MPIADAVRYRVNYIKKYGLKTTLIQWSFTASMSIFILFRRNLYIIQLGANDGVSSDPIHHIIKKKKSNAIVVEAVPYVYNKLVKTYKSFPKVCPVNKAVVADSKIEEIEFHFFQASESRDEENCISFWGSVNANHLQKFRGEVGDAFERLYKKEIVPAITLNQLFKNSSYPKLDILQIDIEGSDVEIVQSIDFSLFRPALIYFEHTHATTESLLSLDALMRRQNYTALKRKYDAVYVRNNSVLFFLPTLTLKLLIPTHFKNTP